MFDNFYTPQQLINTYGYGCYCLNLGDRPLAGIMTGVYPGNFYSLKCSKVMIRVVPGPNDLLTPFDLRAQNFRVDVEFSTCYRGQKFFFKKPP